jgi:starch phosphorylase
MFIFGLTAHEVSELRAKGYHPRAYYERDAELRACIDMIGDGFFSPEDRDRYASIRNALIDGGDHFFLLADYRSYIAVQDGVDAAFVNADDWSRRTILNMARVGRFSSDRAIHEYADKVWGIKPLHR